MTKNLIITIIKLMELFIVLGVGFIIFNLGRQYQLDKDRVVHNIQQETINYLIRTE